MAIPANMAGIERDTVQLALEVSPKIIDRFSGAEPGRVEVHAINGQVTVIEHLATVASYPLYLRWEDLDEQQYATLRQLARGTGPVTVVVEPGGDPLVCSLIEVKGYPHCGDYPNTAPQRIRQRAAEVRLRILTGTPPGVADPGPDPPANPTIWEEDTTLWDSDSSLWES